MAMANIFLGCSNYYVFLLSHCWDTFKLATRALHYYNKREGGVGMCSRTAIRPRAPLLGIPLLPIHLCAVQVQAIQIASHGFNWKQPRLL